MFAAFFALLYVALTFNVIRHRFSKKISLGHGDDKATQIAVRSHANFIEYVPMALLLFYFVEVITLSSTLVFYLASALLIARVFHFFGMADARNLLILRQIGTVVTLFVIIIAAGALALSYIPFSV